MLFITHDLNIVRRIRRPGLRDDRRQDRRAGPDRRGLRATRSTPTPSTSSPPSRRASRRPSHPEAPVVVQADDLKVWFPIQRGFLRRTVGHIKAVDGVDVVVREGQTLGVVGESGSGKTTLGLALLRLISSEGRIVFLGRDIQGARFKEMRPLRADMQIVFQDPFDSLSPRMVVGDVVAEGLARARAGRCRKRSARRASSARWRRSASIRESRFRYPHEFSGGQRQRIAIARAPWC